MSIMTCIKCDVWVDTDYDVEGVWVDKKGSPSHDDPWDLVCSRCVENQFTPEQMEAYDNV